VADLNENEIFDEIDKFEIVSFDIFDTLIKRNIKRPIDIFYIIQNRYNYQNYKKVTHFVQLRIDAEKEARKNSKKGEINLDEIYDFIKINDERVKNKLKEIEINTEIDYCTKNEEMYKVYQYCKANNKKIICISDMYLNNDTIKRILSNNGYFCDDIFISSEYGLTKENGKLFEKVIDLMKIKKSQIIHIGDNRISDFMVPKRLGISAINISNKNKFNKFIKDGDSINKNIIFSIINNNINIHKNFYENFGYQYFGPILYLFTKWIYEKAKEKKIDNLLFCARDMQLTQKIFNNIYNGEIENHYIYISRRSTYLPYLYKHNTFENVCQAFTNGNLTIRDRLNLYNLDVKEDKKINFDKIYEKNELIKNTEFCQYYENYIKEEIKINGKNQFEYLKKYLVKEINNKSSAIVDLGWKGTTQYILDDLYNFKLYGFYFGIYEKYDTIKEKCEALCFNSRDDMYYKYKLFVPITERIFSAFHGTTLYYNDSENKPYILADKEKMDDLNIEKIQDGAYKFCLDIKKYNNDIEFEKELALFFCNRMANLLIEPNLKEARIFGNIEVSDKKIKKIVEYKGIRYYLLNPKELKKDFIETTWRVGFLKQMLKVNLNWNAIAKINRKLKHRK